MKDQSSVSRHLSGMQVMALLGIAAIWHVVYMCLAAFPTEIAILLVRGMLWVAGVAVVAVPIVVVAVVRGSRTQQVLCLAALSMFLVQWFYGGRVALQCRFWITETHMAARVAAWRVSPALAQGHGMFDAHAAPTTSAVALFDGGMLDNWSGFVHDPVSVTNPQSPLNRAARSGSSVGVTRMFGGDLWRVDRLADGWFYCWFT